MIARLAYADLPALLRERVRADEFLDAFDGPGGVFVIYARLPSTSVRMITMVGDTPALVSMLEEDPRIWHTADAARATARALAAGTSTLERDQGEWVVRGLAQIDYATLQAIDPALATFVTEPHHVTGFSGSCGTFVAFRPFDDEDVHICTLLRDTPTRVLVVDVRESDANWGADRAPRVARMLAEGALRAQESGAHLVVDEKLVGAWQFDAPSVPAPEVGHRLPAPVEHEMPIDTTRIDVATLRDLCPALAKRAGESVTVAAFRGSGGYSVVTRPALGQTYIYAMGPTEPSLVVRASNGSGDWLDLDRALGIARMLAEGIVTATMGERFLEIDETTLTEQLLYSDLERWPPLAHFVSSDVFVDGYEGPRGVFVVYRMGSYGGIDFTNVAIVTMRGDERLLVWLLLDDAQGWGAEDSACACAWALADGLIGTKDHDGELVVDEFDADKALDAF